MPMQENEKNTIAKKKRISKFFIAYVLFVAILLTLLLFFFRYAWDSLALYEASQPEYVLEEVVASISENGFSSLSTEHLIFHPLESRDAYVEEMETFIRSYGISYKLIRESYTDGSLLYGLYSGESSETLTKIAEVTLLPASTVSRLYILNITDWQVASVLPYKETLNYSVAVTLPSNVPVSVNSITAGEEYISERADYDFLLYCEDYVQVPEMVTYSFTGLTAPSIIAIGSDTYSFDGSNNISMELDFSQTGISSEMERYVLDAVETYSNFFSRDLEGCRESIDPIRHLFPEDSLYLTLADQYRREDMGVFSSHTNTHFLNESVTEYTVYSENCFSCRIKFDKSMTLSSGREMIDTTDNIYFFVCIDNRWVIADIQ